MSVTGTVHYVEAETRQQAMPTLFDLAEAEAAA